jgi:hypothetical protein
MKIIKTTLILIISLFFLAGYTFDNSVIKSIEHTVLINHPGEKEPIEMILTEIQNEKGLPIQYTTNVESVICLEEVCKIIPVKIYWNNIGVFQKYELKKGATLEKYENDAFEKKDYSKLQSILANSSSPFKEVYLNEILTVPNEHGNKDIDAVSGATALELDEEDTVPGAALTCYTLWHWANGELISKIKTQTGISASNSQLQDFILNRNNTYFSIAIHELQKRNLYSKVYIDTVISKLILDSTYSRKAFSYFKNSATDMCLYATKEVFHKGQKQQKITALQFLIQTTHILPHSYLNTISSEIPKLESYQELSLCLNLMENKNPNSNEVIQNVIPLLKKDMIIARRAYWFLINQRVTEKEKQLLDTFYTNHKNQL